MDSRSSWSPTHALPLDSILPSEPLEPTITDCPAANLFCGSAFEEESGLSHHILRLHDSNLKSSVTAPPLESDFGVKVSSAVDENGCSPTSSEVAYCSNSDLGKRLKVEQGGVPKMQMNQCQVKKLGEKITALQQLVSPFGKTDTASVLLEAIGYIKFLHEQVQVLSSPYMASRLDGKGSEDGNDLRSRGLCLVPVSCTRNVGSSNGADLWISGIRGCSR